LLAGVALVQGEPKPEFEALAEAYIRTCSRKAHFRSRWSVKIIEYQLWRRRFALMDGEIGNL
jgi:hypothetical protein